MGIQRITRAQHSVGPGSSWEETAVATLRALGGYTAVIHESIEAALRAYQDNPRASLDLPALRTRLIARAPEYRRQMQSFLSRVPTGGEVLDRETSPWRPEAGARPAVTLGAHAELDLRVASMRWMGVADVITMSTEHCEIRDFKTGSQKDHHEFQIRVYALLWARDRERNPTGRLVDKLVLSYRSGDVSVAAPNETDLARLEHELTSRTTTAIEWLAMEPPPARPSDANCTFCNVRHLCDEYWDASRVESTRVPLPSFGDIQLRLIGRRGPKSWDAVAIVSWHLRTGHAVVLRAPDTSLVLNEGMQLRLLNAHLAHADGSDVATAELPVVVAVVSGSEAYIIPK